MNLVAFPYKFAGMDLTVDAEYEKPANRHDEWQFSGIEVKNPEGEEISDDLRYIYVRVPGTVTFVTVLSRIEIAAFEEAQTEEDK